MALTKCKDCGNEVSKKAISCPKCGSPLKSKKKTSSFTILVLVLFGSSWLYSTVNDTVKSSPPPTKVTKIKKATTTVSAITITTQNNKARLCPEIDCAQNKEILRIPTNTKLKVLSTSKKRLPMWDVIWYEISYKNKKGWVSEFDTDKAPKEPRYRK